MSHLYRYIVSIQMTICTYRDIIESFCFYTYDISDIFIDMHFKDKIVATWTNSFLSCHFKVFKLLGLVDSKEHAIIKNE